MPSEKAGDQNAPVLRSSLARMEQVSLCEALDRILNQGVVVAGGITISVADIDLIYLGLNVVLSSVETARGDPQGSSREEPVGSGEERR